MGRFKLSASFSLIPEGTHVFRIEEVKYDDDFGKMEIRMKTASGIPYTERYNLLTAEGDVNEAAMRSFGFFAHAALNDYSEREIDEQELVGRYIKAEIVHTKSNQPNPQTGEYRTFANMRQKYPAEGFEGTAAQTTAEVPKAAEKPAETAASANTEAEAALRAMLGL